MLVKDQDVREIVHSKYNMKENKVTKMSKKWRPNATGFGYMREFAQSLCCGKSYVKIQNSGAVALIVPAFAQRSTQLQWIVSGLGDMLYVILSAKTSVVEP